MNSMSTLMLVALTVVLPLSARAQDTPIPDTPICSGQPAQWLGSTAEASDITIAAAALSQQMTTFSGTRPYAMFRVTGEIQALRLEAMSEGDAAIRLETPDGDLLAENDDTIGLNPRIEQSVMSGTYCLQLTAFGNANITATVQVSRLEMPALLADPEETTIVSCTPDTNAEQLATIDLDTTLPVHKQIDGSRHYLRFTLQNSTLITLRAVSEELDPNMVLFNDIGDQVAANDDADGLNSRLDFPSGLAAGVYCLGVAPISAGNGVITVSAEALDRDRYLHSAWSKGEIPPPFDASYPMQVVDLNHDMETFVLHDGTAKWLTFTLEHETVLRISAYGGLVGADTKIVLFSGRGAVVAQADDTDSNIDAVLGPVVLEPGRYRMALTDVNRATELGAPLRIVGMFFERFERIN